MVCDQHKVFRAGCNSRFPSGPLPVLFDSSCRHTRRFNLKLKEEIMTRSSLTETSVIVSGRVVMITFVCVTFYLTILFLTSSEKEHADDFYTDTDQADAHLQ